MMSIFWKRMFPDASIDCVMCMEEEEDRSPSL